MTVPEVLSALTILLGHQVALEVRPFPIASVDLRTGVVYLHADVARAALSGSPCAARVVAHELGHLAIGSDEQAADDWGMRHYRMVARLLGAPRHYPYDRCLRVEARWRAG
jgi:hypothetical protein